MSDTVIKPPFTKETALAKVKAAENAWNTRDPERVAPAYTEDTEWRNRAEFFKGREAVKEFLRRNPNAVILSHAPRPAQIARTGSDHMRNAGEQRL